MHSYHKNDTVYTALSETAEPSKLSMLELELSFSVTLNFQFSRQQE